MVVARWKKEKIHLRKDEVVPYESGSLIHESVKGQREIARNLDSALNSPRTRKKEDSHFSKNIELHW